MQQKTDDQVAVSMVREAKQRFANLNACSFDKGFHSPENQRALKDQLERVALPRKGKLSHTAQAAQQSAAFIKARRAHSAVESAINALEVHGLDMCPDHGIGGFKRYVTEFMFSAQGAEKLFHSRPENTKFSVLHSMFEHAIFQK